MAFGDLFDRAVMLWAEEGQLEVLERERLYLNKAAFSEGSLFRDTSHLWTHVVSETLATEDGFLTGTSEAEYGRFWEEGFTRRGKVFAPRKWAEPAHKDLETRLEELLGEKMQQAIDESFSDRTMPLFGA